MNPLFTNSYFRLKLISSNPGKNFNWIFLPGGPGLGSEIFMTLTKDIKLEGHVWHGDFPGDGSNQFNHETDYTNWHKSLVEAITSLQNVILISHSFSGMYILANKNIEDNLKALVLMNTAPNNSWQDIISKDAEKYKLPDTRQAQKNYNLNRTNESFKELTMASAAYFFGKYLDNEGVASLNKLPYQHRPYDWFNEQFHPHYQLAWFPRNITTLIIAGEYDHITPITLFNEYNGQHIIKKIISNAGHFPWFGENEAVRLTLYDLQKKIIIKS